MRFLNFFCALSLFFSIPLKAQKTETEKQGDFFQILLPSTALAASLLWQDQEDGSMQFLKAFASTFLITHGLKRIIDKTRPNGGRHSFPSGHTSAAFMGAAFLEKRHGWSVGIPAYLLASYVGWTRVEAKQHDEWDVFVGATIGIVSSYFFTTKYKRHGLKLSVNQKGRTLVLAVQYSF